MNVFCVDPGTFCSAYAVWDGVKILDKGHVENDHMTTVLAGYSARSGGLADVEVGGIEIMRGFGMPVGKEVFATCYWIGRWASLWARNRAGRFPVPIDRKDVAVHHCLKASAGDTNISAALKDRFGGKGTTKEPGVFFGVAGADMWSACALAVYLHDRHTANAQFDPFPFESRPPRKK